jgi:hypothetical protein
MAHMVDLPGRLIKQARLKAALWQANRRLRQVSQRVMEQARRRLVAGRNPVIFFNASTRLTGMSLNAAFQFLAASALQLAGAPVVYFACRSGMSRCVLGTDRDALANPPPCPTCLAQSERLFSHAPVVWFEKPGSGDAKSISGFAKATMELAGGLEGLSLEQLCQFEAAFPLPELQLPAIPLGRLVLPGLRWALRRHHLADDQGTRYLLRAYLGSAYQLAAAFARLLVQLEPAAGVIFNGIMYPEATARWVAEQLQVRTITHEVGFQPFSAFFTPGQATAYPIHIPAGFTLSPQQEARLDAYLSQRFQGEFTMAGIRFWPEMRALDIGLRAKMAQFRQVVPVFTNVVYDTSQVHANLVFPHMFAWLDLVLELIHSHPETLFVIRAHPDEMRPGTRKQSRESVQAWVAQHAAAELPNVVFIDSQEYISSYELIRQARFVCVYNSSIGLEATLLGVPVLCAGKARYTQYPMVFFPDNLEAYRRQAESFLDSQGAITLPPEFQRNARNFLYYQLYKASLPFSDFIMDQPRPGFVQLKPFHWEQLTPERSPTIRVLVDGILDGKPFLMPDQETHV